MIMNYKLCSLFIAIVFFAVSCSSDDSGATTDIGLDYMPITQGSWYTYRLDSTIFNDFYNTEITHSYELKIEIGEQIEDGEGQLLTKMRRYIKEFGSAEDFEFQSVWFEKLSNNRLETFEENLHFIKLVFPTTIDKTWEGNQFIASAGNDNPNTSTRYYKDWDYKIVSVDMPMSINDQSFEAVLQVNQANEVGGPGAIQHIVSDEWYARGVGLVKKRMEIVVENCGAPGCSDKNKPVLERPTERKGYILNQELIDYRIAN